MFLKALQTYSTYAIEAEILITSLKSMSSQFRQKFKNVSVQNDWTLRQKFKNVSVQKDWTEWEAKIYVMYVRREVEWNH